ncbi:MAG: hypothetical protein AAFZ15_16460 [Bacteroidota bacterium]
MTEEYTEKNIMQGFESVEHEALAEQGNKIPDGPLTSFIKKVDGFLFWLYVFIAVLAFVGLFYDSYLRNEEFLILKYSKLENGGQDITQRILLYVQLLFLIFTGIVFLFIGDRTNKLIQDKAVKLPSRKKSDYSNSWLSLAVLMWVMVVSIDLLFPLWDNQWNIFVKSGLSTLNSFFFIMAMLDLDFINEPDWKRWKIYPKILKNRQVVILMVVATGAVVLVFTLLFAWLLPGYLDNIYENGTEDSKRFLQLIRFPDIILYSFPTILMIFLHLNTAFIERRQKKFRIVLIFTIVLVFVIQLFPFSEVISGEFKVRMWGEVFYALYRFLLISMFLFLVISWIDFFKGEKLNEELNIAKELRMSMNHRVKNHLGRIEHFSSKFAKNNEVQQNKLALSMSQQLLSRIKVYQELAEQIYGIAKKGELIQEIELVDFLSKLLKEYPKLFAHKRFVFSGLKGFTEDPIKIHVDNAQYLGEHLTELIINILENADDGKDPWVRLEIRNINNAIFIKIYDKNKAFDFYEKTAKNKRGGLRTIYKKVKYSWEGVIEYNHDQELNGNTILLIIPIDNLK